MSIRLVMAGAVDFSRQCLSALVRCTAPLAGVLSLDPRMSARHSDYADLAPQARESGIGVAVVDDINGPAAAEAIRGWSPDVLLILGWSQLLKPPLLSAARLGALGSHPSLLPRNRGRHPIIWQIINQETESGLSLFWLDESVDGGPLFLQERFSLDADEDAGTFYTKVAGAATRRMPDVVRLLESGSPPRMAQDHSQATVLRKRSERDGWIDWTAAANHIHALVRALTHPYPGATTFLGDRPITIWKSRVRPDSGSPGIPGRVISTPDGIGVQTGSGILSVLSVDPAASPLQPGMVLGRKGKA